MHNPFTKHPRENAGKTYLQHLLFACSLGIRLIITGYVFILHSMFPFIKIPAKMNLTETALHLHREEENRLKRLHNEKN